MIEAYFYELWWLLGALFFGVLLGSLTGLIPGFHVNNVALILLALSPGLLELGIPLSAVAAIIVSTGTVHTFLNYIPSALIGAPDGDTALSLLPGHRMLLAGNAARGVAWSARGSQLGLFLSLPLIVVARIAFGPELNWYDGLRDWLPVILLVISLLLLATETTRLDWPRWVQKLTESASERTVDWLDSLLQQSSFCLLDCMDGLCLNCRSIAQLECHRLHCCFQVWPVCLVLPISSTSMQQQAISPQKENWDLPPVKPLIAPCFWSAVAGASMGVLPGMTASQATVLVMGGRNVAAKVQGKEGYGMDWETRRLTELSDEELLEIAVAEAEDGYEGPQTKQDLEVIAILSAVNTAVTVMVLGFLYIIGRSRSGATLALKMMYPIETWNSTQPTADFVRLLAVTLAPATADQKHGAMRGLTGGKSQFSFCGGRWLVVA